MYDITDSGSMGEGHSIGLRPQVATLHVAGDVPLDETATVAAVLKPTAQARRRRSSERLFYLFNPTGQASQQLCRELREIVRQAYWSTPGSVTAALRRTIAAANRHLFEHNLNSPQAARCYGGVACAVLRDRDLFLLQAGPVWACILQETEFRCFPFGEKLAHLGIGPVADVRLHHVLADPGDTLLLAPYALLRDATEEGLRRTLSREGINSVAAGLRRLGGDNFAALVARWEAEPETGTGRYERAGQLKAAQGAPPAPAPTRRRREETVSGQPAPQRQRVPAPAAVRRIDRPRTGTTQRLARCSNALTGAIKGIASAGYHLLMGGLRHLWHAVAALGAGLVALGRWLIGAAGTALRSTLPGTGRSDRRRVRPKPPPEENRVILTALAIATPIVILVAVLFAYREFAAEARFQAFTRQAEAQIALAQAAEPNSEQARLHWERAMQQVDIAAALFPDEPSTEAMRAQVQEALDDFDAIERLVLTELASFGSGSRARRMVLANQMVFILDAAEGWVSGVSARVSEATDDDGQEQIEDVLINTGQRVGGDDVGELVDFAWLEAEGGRRSSGLLVLDSNHRVVSYDPAWRTESGAAQLRQVRFESTPTGRPLAVGSYEGQFYVLDSAAESAGQIWRYKPEGDAYPREPEGYFTTPPPRGLDTASDIAIDGHIYILYADGVVSKFLGGDSQPFDVRRVPNGLGEVAGFAVDPEGDGTVYIADRGNARIVALGPDGQFETQFRASGALENLEALAVDQSEGKLFVLDQGKLYVASLR